MSTSRRVLIIDDSADDAELVVRALRRGGYDLTYERVDTPETLRTALDSGGWDIVIADYSMPRFDGLAALKLVKEKAIDLAFILVSGTAGEELAVQAMKAGAHDYILKNNLARLPLAVERELRDAEERRQHRLAEARYRNLFDRVPVGVFSTTPAGAVVEANPTFVAMLGFDDVEALKQVNIEELWVEPQERTRFLAIIANEGVVQNFEMQIRRADGNIIWCAESVRAMCDSEGRVDRYEGVSVDITDRKRAQQELEQRQHELERSNEDLEHFAYVASHDLREPLRMVSGFADLFARRFSGSLDTTADEYISHMIGGVRRMEQLIASLLSYSRAGKGEPFAAADMNRVADRAIASLAVGIEERGARVTHERLPQVEGDEAALASVVSNLVGNAIKFNQRAPAVHIAGQDKGDEWVFSVRDNGIGIESKYVESIFAMFQRLHTRSEYPGSGIGLAICKRVIERHGGKIWVESKPGEGSTFRFTIKKPGHLRSAVSHGNS